jgi:hypothetical protein
MLSESELTQIDDWRFANRVATRSDAIRRMAQIALRFERNVPEIKRALTAKSARAVADAFEGMMKSVEAGDFKSAPDHLIAAISPLSDILVACGAVVASFANLEDQAENLRRQETFFDGVAAADEIQARFEAYQKRKEGETNEGPP